METRPRFHERMLRRLADVGFVAALGLSSVAPAIAEDDSLFETDEDGAYVYASRSLDSPRVGHVEPGNPVRRRYCGRECDPGGGFVGVEPFGYMTTRGLRPYVARPAPPETRLVRVARRTPLRSRPAPNGSVVRHLRAGHSIAVLSRSLGAPFAERPNGTFVESAYLEEHRPSRFEGEVNPRGTLAFALVDQPLPNGSVMRRYDRRVVDRHDASTVVVGGVPLPRASFRIARPRSRPRRIPEHARWVHVDVEEQVLTAYEGDRWTFATLVTTGAYGHSTVRGTFRLQQKTRSMTMEGDADANYLVENVTDVLFFQSGYGLHAAYWHDRFGERGSHGCVNLSPADAARLHRWAPPSLPDGWTTIYPDEARLERLWVVVE